MPKAKDKKRIPIAKDRLSFTQYNVTQEKEELRKYELNPISNPRDRLCRDLLAAGRSNSMITRLTGYTDAQCYYRATAWGIRRRAYRDGEETDYTKPTMNSHKNPEFQRGLIRHLQKTCPAKFEQWMKDAEARSRRRKRVETYVAHNR